MDQNIVNKQIRKNTLECQIAQFKDILLCFKHITSLHISLLLHIVIQRGPKKHAPFSNISSAPLEFSF